MSFLRVSMWRSSAEKDVKGGGCYESHEQDVDAGHHWGVVIEEVCVFARARTAATLVV